MLQLQVVEGRYGQVGAQGEGRLAEQARPDPRLNMYQVMHALYLKNPDAFLEDNLNHLKPGAILVLPSLQEIQQVDHGHTSCQTLYRQSRYRGNAYVQ